MEDEAVLVTLAVGYDDVLEVLHDVLRRPRHQVQTPLIVGLHVVMTVREPEAKHNAPSSRHPYREGRIQPSNGRNVPSELMGCVKGEVNSP